MVKIAADATFGKKNSALFSGNASADGALADYLADLRHKGDGKCRPLRVILLALVSFGA